jgi:peroxiredoxin
MPAHFTSALLILTMLASSALAASVPGDPRDTHPLTFGTLSPTVSVRNADGSERSIGPATLAKPTVLIFYRGGWCPYCNAHLHEFKQAEPGLLALGFDIYFLSADRPELLYSSLKEPDIHYVLLSDAWMNAARAYGIAFRVDDSTSARYKSMGIDLEAASGESHHELPVPAVFILDRKGVIRFAYANPDYKVRLKADDLLAAARKVADAQ